MTPMDAIVSATRNIAAAYHKLDSSARSARQARGPRRARRRPARGHQQHPQDLDGDERRPGGRSRQLPIRKCCRSRAASRPDLELEGGGRDEARAGAYACGSDRIAMLECLGVPAEPGLAIVGATVIDGTGGGRSKDAVVWSSRRQDHRGRPARAASPYPPGARQIERTGKFVIPGLMDANVHLVLGSSIEFIVALRRPLRGTDRGGGAGHAQERPDDGVRFVGTAAAAAQRARSDPARRDGRQPHVRRRQHRRLQRAVRPRFQSAPPRRQRARHWSGGSTRSGKRTSARR